MAEGLGVCFVPCLLHTPPLTTKLVHPLIEHSVCTFFLFFSSCTESLFRFVPITVVIEESSLLPDVSGELESMFKGYSISYLPTSTSKQQLLYCISRLKHWN